MRHRCQQFPNRLAPREGLGSLQMLCRIGVPVPDRCLQIKEELKQLLLLKTLGSFQTNTRSSSISCLQNRFSSPPHEAYVHSAHFFAAWLTKGEKQPANTDTLG